MTFVHSRGVVTRSTFPRIRYAFDTSNKLMSGVDLDWFEKRIGPYLPTCDDLGVSPVSGRLGSSIAPNIVKVK